LRPVEPATGKFKDTLCRFLYHLLIGDDDIAHILVIARGGSESGQVEHLRNDSARHRFVFKLPDASSAEDYVAVHIRIEVFSINLSDLLRLQTVMTYGVARADRYAVAASIALVGVYGLWLPVDDTPYARDTVTDAQHALIAFILKL
jgi:hypothetical protein